MVHKAEVVQQKIVEVYTFLPKMEGMIPYMAFGLCRAKRCVIFVTEK